MSLKGITESDVEEAGLVWFEELGAWGMPHWKCGLIIGCTLGVRFMIWV